MQAVAWPVAKLTHAVSVFVGIGLSVFVLLSSVRGNTADLEKVNYTLTYYTVNDYWLQVRSQRTKGNRLSRLGRKQTDLYLSWMFKLTCWFTFQCPNECQCNLGATNITRTCPDGLSTVEVEYPSGEWTMHSVFQEGEDEESIAYAPITIYFWYDTGLNNITHGAFKEIQNISKCYLIMSWNNIRGIQERQFEELSKVRGLLLDNNNISSLHQNAFIGLDSLVHLDLGQNKIVNIMPNLFQNLTYLKNLYISHNDISLIGQGDFKGLDRLELLDVGYNNIFKIHSRGFQGLTNVLFLYLDHNNMTTIHLYLFQDLKKVRHLFLAGNRFFDISPLQFQTLTSLTHLYLNHNMISEIHPLQFQNLRDLISLDISHNSIPEIHPLPFQNLHGLISLEISHNTISEIHPLQFQTLTSLRHINLNHNVISEIHLLQFQNLRDLFSLDISHNTISTIHPLLFKNLSRLYYLDLGYNILYEIHPLQFQNCILFTLDLSHNMISEIPTRALQVQNVTYVTDLILDHNKISKIHSLQFQHLDGLLFLYLQHNNISDISPSLFPKRILKLNLAYNRISKIHQEAFQSLSRLEILKLQHNIISEIHPLLFQILGRVIALQLDHNEITEIHPNQFQTFHDMETLDLSHNNLVKFSLAPAVNLSELKYLSLSNNKLRVLSYTMFQHMSSLKYLDVSSNHINMINSKIRVNNSIAQIEIMDLRQNKLFLLNPESFSEFYNTNLTILVDNEATCCFITTASCSATIPRSQFLTCGRLLPNQIQRVNMGILGLFAILSNLGVLFHRYQTKKKENKVQLLLITNLSISDMIMGIYMIIISSADLYYKRTFPSELWRVSFACKFAGTLSVLSSEASVFFVTMISVDRLIGIRYPFSTYRIGTKTSRILSLVLWLIAISISIVSTILSSVHPNLYDVSEVCTGLPLSRRNVYEEKIESHNLGWTFDGHLFVNTTYDVVTSHQPGMYFGIAIFTALNFICLIVVSVCYIGIFMTSIQTAKKAGRARDSKQEHKMAIKMGAIVISDLACWTPIIILTILVQSGRHVVSPRVYTWIVTFVLPINSAINPFLYTLAALIFDYINMKRTKC